MATSAINTSASSLSTGSGTTSLVDIIENRHSSVPGASTLEYPLIAGDRIFKNVDKNINNDEWRESHSDVIEASNPPESSRNPLSRRKNSSLPTIPSASKMIAFMRDSKDLSTTPEVRVSKGDELNNRTKRKRRRLVHSQKLRQVAPILSKVFVDKKLMKSIPSARHRVASPTAEPCSKLQLSADQYECVLRRRAIQKKKCSPLDFILIQQPRSHPKLSLIPSEDDIEAKELQKYGIKVPQESFDHNDDETEIEGDTSLGMKLTILSGKVIVQGLISLQDGRASPAQLDGMIARGDIILSIDGRPLLGLGNLELLMKRLEPLSTPNESGLYERRVRVRFAVGEGLQLLAKSDGDKREGVQPKQKSKNENKFRVGTYTMVDQLSGMPIFDHMDSDGIQSKGEMSAFSAKDREPIHSVTPLSPQKTKHMSLNRIISIRVAIDQQRNKSNFTSKYFSMNEEASSLLRPMEYEIIPESFEDATKRKNELLAQGRHALVLAKYLYNQVEFGPLQKKIDPLEIVRSECRSFSSRSRFSQKYILHHDSDEESIGQDGSDSDSMADCVGDEGGGDEMLLQLAVWNRSWKKSMVETLEAASVHTREKKKGQKLINKKAKSDSLESQLQNLLFGFEVAEIISKKKPTVALPPDEITEVLFDLSSQVTATIPSNVSIVDGFDASLHELDQYEVPSPLVSSTRIDTKVLEATRFLLDDIMPAWMDTFKPIPILQRRVIWPSIKDGSSVATPDDLSMESAATGWSTGTPERRAKLEDKIAYLELDADTKSDTCELITFYFTRKILPAISVTSHETHVQIDQDAEKEAVNFVELYGSYLKLFDSFVAASESFSDKVMQSLLMLAKYDPNHNDCMKQLVRTPTTLSYESKFLSCLLVRLFKSTLSDSEASMLESILSLIASGYPEIKPWQVRLSMPSFSGVPGEIIQGSILEKMEAKDMTLYFSYISSLMDISQMARMDKTLVREWCVMSTSTKVQVKNPQVMENFLKVASRVNEMTYCRDLSFLIDTSVLIQNTPLTLELVDEIVESSKMPENVDRLDKALEHLMSIAKRCIENADGEEIKNLDRRLIHQVLMILNKIGLSAQKRSHESISLSEEVLKLLTLCTRTNSNEDDLIMIMTETISPTDFLSALSSWRPSESMLSSSIISALRNSLTEGVKLNTAGQEKDGEVSVALLRVREIRYEDANHLDETEGVTRFIDKGMTIWETMERGMYATINK